MRFINLLLSIIFLSLCFNHYLAIANDGFSFHLRSYYMNRSFDVSPTITSQESGAIGGWIGYQGSIQNILGIQMIGYTSQGLIFANPQKAGTGLLNYNQQGYSVLGQANAFLNLGDTNFTMYRQSLNTPFLDPYDYRMTPQTYEAYIWNQKYNSDFSSIFGYVDKYKPWSATEFFNLGKTAGLPVDRGLLVGGINYLPFKNNQLQLWNYYAFDLMNIFFCQYDQPWIINDDLTFISSIQIIDQQSLPSTYYNFFHAQSIGFLSKFLFNALTINLGFNINAPNYDIVHPWGSNPSYPSYVMIEEQCELAGEQTIIFGIKYDYTKLGLKGLTSTLNSSFARIYKNGTWSNQQQQEYNLTFEYKFNQDSDQIKLRGALVNNSLTLNCNYYDIRLIYNKDF